MEQLPPSYDSINENEEVPGYTLEDLKLKIPYDTVKIITDSNVYEIPRENCLKVANSFFGKYFLTRNEKNSGHGYETELKWTLSNAAIEEFVISIIKENAEELIFVNPKIMIGEMKNYLSALENLGLKNYFISTSYGENWMSQIAIQDVFTNVLNKRCVWVRICEILKKAINIALISCIYNPEYEIAKNGKIALSKKDITAHVINSANKVDGYTDRDLLMYFCQYCEIETFRDNIYRYLYYSLFQPKGQSIEDVSTSENNWFCIKPICVKESRDPCCFQSTYHRHIKFNLVGLVNSYVL